MKKKEIDSEKWFEWIALMDLFKTYKETVCNVTELSLRLKTFLKSEIKKKKKKNEIDSEKSFYNEIKFKFSFDFRFNTKIKFTLEIRIFDKRSLALMNHHVCDPVLGRSSSW